ncbi:MAG: undecaprenyl-diphosphate phosphatase [Coriobacteriaceae bacterium]|nr:undecaprenyl-diphosphate phosphatase [Coriobacteriaceae bacterium]MDD6769235.1 undecaprenyl-diphosphate phosphatase [Coriobacteriaceae bacterium]
MLKAFFFGLVEGITEWLPVSSTGHLVLFNNFITMDVSAEFMEMFTVVIQLGAIMAVIILYFSKLNPFSRKKTPQQRKGTWSLWGKVVVGCIPAAIVGVALDDWADAHLYNAVVIAGALILYGVIFIVIERLNKRQGAHTRRRVQEVEELDLLTAFKIGCFQCLAIVPGTSRSGSTIIGGLLCGCSRVAASEFSFFMAIPVMFGWSVLKIAKLVLGGVVLTSTELAVGAVGLVVAFVTSVLSIKFLMGYIQKHDFGVFGWYRIALAVVVLVAVFGFGLDPAAA